MEERGGWGGRRGRVLRERRGAIALGGVVDGRERVKGRRLAVVTQVGLVICWQGQRARERRKFCGVMEARLAFDGLDAAG